MSDLFYMKVKDYDKDEMIEETMCSSSLQC